MPIEPISQNRFCASIYKGDDKTQAVDNHHAWFKNTSTPPKLRRPAVSSQETLKQLLKIFTLLKLCNEQTYSFFPALCISGPLEKWTSGTVMSRVCAPIAGQGVSSTDRLQSDTIQHEWMAKVAKLVATTKISTYRSHKIVTLLSYIIRAVTFSYLCDRN